MNPNVDSSNPFAGIAEKLKRANENILNLQSEIATFTESGDYTVIPDVNSEEWQKAVNYNRDRVIPLRFAVLSGEVIHHLRSCLDHVVWHFSSAQYRIERENSILFPVLQKAPIKKEELVRYQGNIKGITNPKVLRLIDEMQPYHRGDDALNDPICIIHDMDRFDKHRELVVTNSVANLHFPPGTPSEGIAALMKHSEGNKLTPAELAAAQVAMKNDMKVAPGIAFAQVGKRKTQPVIPTLTQLKNHLASVIGLFAKEL